jgi:hypothetical protein
LRKGRLEVCGKRKERKEREEREYFKSSIEIHK